MIGVEDVGAVSGLSDLNWISLVRGTRMGSATTDHSTRHPAAMVRQAHALLGMGWEHAKTVARVSDEMGFPAFLVGGCVRDLKGNGVLC